MSTFWKWLLNLLTPSEQTQHDWAVSNLTLEGHDDLTILEILGPRPRPKNFDVQRIDSEL